jgi:hypothetical protein
VFRFLICVLCCVCSLLLVGVADVSAQAIGMCETLMPDTTQGFFAISNVDTLTEHWDATQLGHLMADPVMEPFKKDLHRQFEARWSTVHDRLGLTLDDMKGVPGGDVAIGLILPAPGKSAMAIVMDVTGKLPQAHEMLQKANATQAKRGAKRSEVKIEGCPDPVIQFDLPELEEEKEAGKSALQGSPKSETEKAAPAARAPAEVVAHQAFYCLTGNLFAVTDNFEVIKGILERAMKRRNDSLANHKPFQVVMQRCKLDYHEGMPQTRWYIHPLGYAEAARASTPEYKRRKGRSILEIMRHQGVGAILGVGGIVDFSAEGYEMVHRTAVYAPPPYEKAMKMLVLPNQPEFTPQPWVPRDVATYTTLYFDILNAFDNFGPLFDEVLAMGEEGTWQETLVSFKGPTGPQVDLREDLIKHLGRRVSVLTDYQLPITTTSERLLFVIETVNPKAVAASIEKLMKNDPAVKRREVNGQVIWEFVEDESPTTEGPPVITFGEAPAVAPARSLRKAKRDKDAAPDEEEPEEHPLLPHAALTVWEGNLFVASHIDILLKVLAPAEKAEPLSEDVDYLLVNEEIKKFEPKEKCVRMFSRTDEEYRPTYELVRQNKMPESETMLARVLNGLFGEGKRGTVREQKIDGSQLPDYQVVRRYLGDAGLQVTSEAEGWYLKGFTLTK